MKFSTMFLSVTVVTASLYGESMFNHSCVLQPQVESCSDKAKPEDVDTCCTETFGGLVLLTQFWSTYTGLEDEGQLLPEDQWTIHGLWPDFCNGSYTQYCDLTRQFDPYPSPNTTTGTPDGTLVSPYTGPEFSPWADAGKLDLLAYMNTHWINRDDSNWVLWMHEYSKHATCFSTFDTPCYGPRGIPQHQDVVEYAETVVMYHQRLPTWAWLAAAGVTPSNSTRYTLGALEEALEGEYRAVPYLGCSGPRFNETGEGEGSGDGGYTVLSEAWYFFHVLGRPQDGVWAPQERAGKSSCARAEGAILYPERSGGSVRGMGVE